MVKQWRLKQGDVLDWNGGVVAVVASHRGHNKEAIEDAVLIAAAPELLEAILDLKFKLYGNGPANPGIESLLNRLEIDQ